MTTPLTRTLLFVPGNRPERFAKALAAGADRVIVDFEDAVQEADKAQAREHLQAFLDSNPEARVWVRVNMASHGEHGADLVFCRHPGVAGVMLPKAETAVQVAAVAAVGKPVMPIIESARGLAAVPALVAVAGVERLTFGGLDLGLDLGLAAGSVAAERMLDQARFALLLQSRLAAVAAPIDTVFPAFDDLDGLARFARNASEMGFAGMLCIHPKQVAAVHQALAPSAEQLAWAQRVVAGNTGTGAYQVDGQMVDAPVIERAQRLLALAG
ncbi:MAG: CoA ester lyase [Pseudomonas sp.]